MQCKNYNTQRHADRVLHTIADTLAQHPANAAPVVPPCVGHMPSPAQLAQAMQLIRSLMFPGFFDETRADDSMRPYFAGVNVTELYGLMRDQIRRAIRLSAPSTPTATLRRRAERLALDFVQTLPQLRNILLTDVEAMYNGDPAATNRSEVIFCYPAVTGILHHRVAHTLLTMGVPLLPRMIAEMAHSATGIDIHPGAEIGPYFSIDHGTGIVIGETCRIGHHVSIYQGVTLGAKSFVTDSSGRPVNLPRHPIIHNHVTIYSNATILGRVTIGEHSVIGGNVWLTHSLPPHSRLLQSRPVEAPFADGAGI